MKKTVLFLAIAAVVGTFIGCGNDDSLSPKDDIGTGRGRLTVLLTDAPASFDAVNVTFSEVSVHKGSETSEADSSAGWLVISNEVKTFDLLTLSNGATSLLGEKELEEGHYTQLRLVLTGAEVVVDGTSYSLDVPSGELKFANGFDIKADIPVELVVDFDAARSIHQTGKKENYKLKPVIRITKKTETGSIGGTVVNYSNLPIAYAIAGADTVTSSTVNPDNGRFTLAFLPSGSYTVAVQDTSGLTFTNPQVTVTAGEKNDLGEITLQ